MGNIEIQRPTQDDLDKRNVKTWPVWEKEVSRFDWHYNETEECYLLEGRVVVETEDGESVEFGKGDFVTFPKGLSCVWDVKEPVKKHYNFRE
ncbi:MAG: cupin domain-containing protein [Desulfobacteraceae bacterium]